MTLQGRSLERVGSRVELDGYANNSVRWDATLSQRFSPLFSIYLDVNNFTNQPEEAFLGDIIYPTNQDYYSWTADIGVRLNF